MWILLILLLTRYLVMSNITQKHGMDLRIVDGFKQKITSYPYSVFLEFKIATPKCCGSSLITAQAILTSGFCLREIYVYKGVITAYLGGTTASETNVIRTIVGFYLHPKYVPETGSHNLGIAFLDSRVPLGKTIQKVPLAKGRYVPEPGQHVYTCGWGKQVFKRFKDNNPYIRHLVVSDQMVITRRQCYEKTKIKKLPECFCTSSYAGLHYYGDSGNGLVTKHPRFIAGVISFIHEDITIYSPITSKSDHDWAASAVRALFQTHCKKTGKKPRN